MRQRNRAATTPGDHTNPRAELGRELERSRRYNRSFALVRVHVNALNGSNGNDELAGSRLGSTRRAVDQAWAWGQDFVYLLPECDRDDATGFVTRLANVTGMELATTIACFPDDGLTSGLLIDLVLGDVGDVHNAHPAATNGNGHGNGNGSANGNGRGNGNGAALATWRQQGSLLNFMRKRRRAHANAAIEWKQITPSPSLSDRDEPTHDTPLVANTERAAR